MLNDRTPLGIGLSGVVLLVVGTAMRELLPRVAATGALVVGIGWVLIIIAVLWFVINLITGKGTGV